MKNQYNLLLDCLLFISLSFYSLQTVFASSMAVDSLELPIASFHTEDTVLCGPQGLKINNLSSNYTELIWEIEGGTNFHLLQDGSASVAMNEAGIFDVTLIAVNECGSDTLKREDYLTINGLHMIVTKDFLRHECGKGAVYRFCVESENEIADYRWNRDCLSGTNTEECCELGFKRSISAYTVIASVDFASGCSGMNQNEVYGDFDYVDILWVNGPLYFCVGDSISIPSGTVGHYPTDCTVEYGNTNTINAAGTYMVSSKVRYKTCEEIVNVPIEVLEHPNFKKNYDTICVNELLPLEFDVVSSNFGFQTYVNGGTNPHLSAFEPYAPGSYEITAVNELINNYNSAECPSSDTLFVEVLPIPEVKLQYEEKICRNISEYVTIIAEHIEGLPPYSYDWRLNNAPLNIDTSVVVIPISELPDVYNTVLLTVTHDNGCSDYNLRANFTVDICDDIEGVNNLPFLLVHQISSEQLLIKAENAPVGKMNLIFYNLLGAKVLEQTFSNVDGKLEKRVELQSINSGIYVLQLQSEKGLIKSRKIWVK